MSTPASEAVIVEALRKMHPAPEWAFLPGCGNGTGGRRERSADALAMSLWPSRGIELHGFEVKSHRGDWLRERKDPEKAEEIAQRCHRWSLVVADEKVTMLAEVPPAWGLLRMEGRKLVVVRAATLREPKALTWNFLAALLRTSAKGTEALLAASVPRAEVDETVAARLKAEAGPEAARLARELAAVMKTIANFETQSGVKLDDWRYPWAATATAEALKLLIEHGGPTHIRAGHGASLRMMAVHAEREIEHLKRIAHLAETAAAGLGEEAA